MTFRHRATFPFIAALPSRAFALAMGAILMAGVSQASVTLDFVNGSSPFDGGVAGNGLVGASEVLFDPAAGANITITTLDIIGQDGTLASDGINLHFTDVQNGTTMGINDFTNGGGYGNNGRDFNPGEGWVVSFDVEVQLEEIDFASQGAGTQMTISSSAFSDFLLNDGVNGSDTHNLGDTVVPAGTAVTIQMTSLASAADTSVRIDNFTFAIPPIMPIDTFSVQSGDLLAATTWDSSTAPIGPSPSPNVVHNIVSGHAVTANGSTAYNGQEVSVTDGSLTYSASAVQLPLVTVAAGATVTETTTGDFFLGDIGATTLGQMELNGQLTITAENGADAGLDMELSGTGTADVNVSQGGSLFVTSAEEFTGLLQFNGSGDEVLYEGPGGGTKTLEMNSTGINRLAANPDDFNGITGEVVFHQAGQIDHRSDGSTNNNNRLVGIGTLTANADITIDLTKTYDRMGTPNERRLFAGDGWRGTGNITATGTATDPTSGNVTLNQLEIGSSDQDGPTTTHVATDNYSGTLTLNDYLNMEVRHNIPSAKIVVNGNSRIEFGFRDVESVLSLSVGEVTVNSGGSLEVGHEINDLHAPFGLQLTKQTGGSGNLTLNGGATTIMQISGTDSDKFDRISAEGMVNLDGNLELLFNPVIASQTVICGDAGVDCVYTPTDGDTFEIISIAAETLAADYNGNGTVGPEDYDVWAETLGSDGDLSADGNGNGLIDAADYTVWRDNLGASGALTGSITGDFSSMTIVDPDSVLTGFTVSRAVTSTSVTLTINAIVPANSVPEPSVLSLVGVALAMGTCRWRRRRSPHVNGIGLKRLNS